MCGSVWFTTVEICNEDCQTNNASDNSKYLEPQNVYHLLSVILPLLYNSIT